jgi:TPR repeat protein
MRTLILVSAAALTCLALTACGDSSTSKTDGNSAPKTDVKPGESSKFAAELTAVMTKSGQGPVSGETLAAIKDAVAKYSEKDAMTFLSSPRGGFESVQGQRMVYLASKSAFEKFGSAQTQFLYALREAKGLGTAANPGKAMEILGMSATGESRDNMWLMADLLMRQPDAADQKDKIRALLEKSKKLGSGEAEKLLEKL